ncbi:unnamed protein product [Chondrus crispus]|uniref:Uncharacterized protein n=1 Tax=Chondrus crispus TaxID=2769 RepID=R7QB79_CHOCR|nr:unnamed protein product [Chondrus crispus]CDF35329.1 unnamed protein product [Chondrus crispus]|eukprot:XP_005715148.1 unnamed protein product [Chondrus crispus]
MKTIQEAYRCLQSELQLGPQDWPCAIGMIMTALNETPLKRLRIRADGVYRSPLQVMTGIKPTRVVIHTTYLA